MQRPNMKEQAKALGISVAALKRRKRQLRASEEAQAAHAQLSREAMTAGWNPRAGNRRKR